MLDTIIFFLHNSNVTVGIFFHNSFLLFNNKNFFSQNKIDFKFFKLNQKIFLKKERARQTGGDTYSVVIYCETNREHYFNSIRSGRNLTKY